MARKTMIEAIRMALSRALEEDPNVILFGEDVGIDGGVFRVTDGLMQRFGAARVRDTPLSEAVIAGTAVGAAANGLRPVAEIQFMGFLYSAIDQLANHAARLRNRTRGHLTCPMVLRAPYGGGIHAPEHHSESMEAMLAHVPGLRVVIPSSPARAYGLLLAAIRDPDPVVFLEPKRIYRSVKEAVEDDGTALPLDRAFTLREGRHVTLVGWGGLPYPYCVLCNKWDDKSPFCSPAHISGAWNYGRCKLLGRRACRSGTSGSPAGGTGSRWPRAR